LLAAALLPGEPVGMLTWVGGALIVVAALVGAAGQSGRSEEETKLE